MDLRVSTLLLLLLLLCKWTPLARCDLRGGGRCRRCCVCCLTLTIMIIGSSGLREETWEWRALKGGVAVNSMVCSDATPC